MVSKKFFFQISGCLFVTVGVVHLVRAILGLQLVLGPLLIPGWLSFFAAIFLFYFAYHAFTFADKTK